jgi:hypothetical protein
MQCLFYCIHAGAFHRAAFVNHQRKLLRHAPEILRADVRAHSQMHEHRGGVVIGRGRVAVAQRKAELVITRRGRSWDIMLAVQTLGREVQELRNAPHLDQFPSVADILRTPDGCTKSWRRKVPDATADIGTKFWRG